MKFHVLLGALVLTTMTAKAQLSTINENFDAFTSGTNTFPQNGWSAKLATSPFPPSPLMIVTTDSNKAIQAYSGSNSSQPSYLISPQIVAPTGDKSLSFKATLIAPSPGPGSIQIGLASDPTDMTTFVAVGNPYTLSNVGSTQTITLPITSSTASYIVFKFTPTASHVAIQVDDVIYNTTSSLGVLDQIKNKNNTQFVVTENQEALQFVSKDLPQNVHIYSAGGSKVFDGKLKNNLLNISQLEKGIYYIQIEEKNGSLVTSKFIKK